MKIRITNQETFHYLKEVVDVELDGLHSFDGYFEGTLAIETEDSYQTFSGQHHANDFVREYGFEIVK